MHCREAYQKGAKLHTPKIRSLDIFGLETKEANLKLPNLKRGGSWRNMRRSRFVPRFFFAPRTVEQPLTMAWLNSTFPGRERDLPVGRSVSSSLLLACCQGRRYFGCAYSISAAISVWGAGRPGGLPDNCLSFIGGQIFPPNRRLIKELSRLSNRCSGAPRFFI